jgi:glycosyltransferase involved in cell wall biosynthesis
VTRPVVVQHSFGDPGSGGPITALGRVLGSRLAGEYEFVRMHQEHAVGGVGLPLIRRWARFLREVRPDLVHVRGLGSEGFRGALAARLAGCPRVLVSIHGTVRDLQGVPDTLRHRTLVRAIEPATLRLATDVVTVCRAASGREFLDPYRHKLLGEITNGVDVPAAEAGARGATRAALGIRDGSVVLAVIGRLSIEKGHLVLAEALRRLPAGLPHLTLLVVGDGPDRAAVETAYGTGADVDIRFLGRRLDVPDLLQASDVFVFPTLHENLSNALLEAMAAALPVIATSVGGNVEVVTQGGGELVPAGDAGTLASSIARFATSSDLRARHGADARAVVEAGYTVDRMIGRLDEVYREILEGGPPWRRRT